MKAVAVVDCSRQDFGRLLVPGLRSGLDGQVLCRPAPLTIADTMRRFVDLSQRMRRETLEVFGARLRPSCALNTGKFALDKAWNLFGLLSKKTQDSV